MIAKTFAGLENVLADELIGLGADKIETLKRGVRFYGDKKLMYLVNLSCRTALYILKPISMFTVHDENDLYKKISEIPWWKFMDVKQTLAVDAVVYHSKLTHSKYVALKTKDAIADQFRKREDIRPSVDIQFPDIRIHVHISNNNCTVSLNSSGDPLYKRGYRVSGGAAPLNEVLAAGLLHLSGWDKKT
ncbi:MAG: RNA methyltransferase, partial [Bacteroidales bacterium]|nr:RNA methyltransferase [Bacteroidales bacterium]